MLDVELRRDTLQEEWRWQVDKIAEEFIGVKFSEIVLATVLALQPLRFAEDSTPPVPKNRALQRTQAATKAWIEHS